MSEIIDFPKRCTDDWRKRVFQDALLAINETRDLEQALVDIRDGRAA